MATYNGEKFIDEQIKSLKDNKTLFTLHWLDDCSTDGTREAVRSAALHSGIQVIAWHHQQRQGVPGAFFKLLECVDSDIYLFCDQDDIWQPGKIDAAVENLLPELTSPVLCFSDVLMFRNHEPVQAYRLSDVLGARLTRSMRESRTFMSGVVVGNSQTFTKPLRDLFLTHRDIALKHALMHDTWMYVLAAASGSVRLLPDVPTTLWRWHENNMSNAYSMWRGRGPGHIVVTWAQHQRLRRALSREALGFIRASGTLPSGPKLERLLEIAQLIAKLRGRQSPCALARLLLGGMMWPKRSLALSLAAVCLISQA